MQSIEIILKIAVILILILISFPLFKFFRSLGVDWAKSYAKARFGENEE